jgi:hypothetical protein
MDQRPGVGDDQCAATRLNPCHAGPRPRPPG